MPNRLDRAAEFADNLRDLAASRHSGLDVEGYLAGAEDALRWVLGDVPEATVTDALERLGVPVAARLLPGARLAPFRPGSGDAMGYGSAGD